MALGTMSAKNTFLYFLLPGSTLNRSKRDLLKEKLEFLVVVHDCTIFTTDEPLCRYSGAAKQFFDTKNIQVSDWPGNSSDLYLIENSSVLLKNKASERKLTSFVALKNTTKKFW